MAIHVETVPEIVTVREDCSVKIFVTSNMPVVTGDMIEFQFPNSWSLFSGPSFTREFQTSDPAKEHYVNVSSENADFEISIEKNTWYFPKGVARHGRKFTAKVISGNIEAGQKIKISYENTYAPYIADDSRVWLKINGKEPETLPEIKVAGDEHKFFRVITPSYVKPGEEFDILIVSLDKFENESTTKFSGKALKDNSGNIVKDNISFTGSIRIPYKLKEEGVFRFVFEDTISTAIKAHNSNKKLFWGDIHIHTKLSHDAQGNNPYTYTKNVSGLDFAASADHWESLGEKGYELIEKWAEEEYEPGKFVTIPADERNSRELQGHHNVYFRNIELMHKYRAIHDGDFEAGQNSFLHLQDADKNDVMLIPHHTGLAFSNWSPPSKGCSIKWDAFDDKGMRPVMEIYSHHGQSEVYNPQHFLAYEWNRMRNPERRANCSVPGPHYAQDYWMQGQRIGVIGSSDEHSGQGGRIHGGIAGVLTDELTRDKIFDGILNKQTYATTGERILVEFNIDDLKMSDCGKRKIGDKINISLKVWATDIILRLEILKHVFGKDKDFTAICSLAPRPEGLDTELTFEDTIEGACVYYARVTQEPIEWPAMAWTTPIWIDV